MARQVITKLIDDLGGGEADETVSFAFDGIAYTIDLNSRNAAKFRDLMSPYQQAGSRAGRVGQSAQLRPYGRQTQAATQRSDRDQNKVIRDWAAANGYELSDRGRIPQSIVEAFERKEPNPVWLARQQVEQAQQQADALAKEQPAPVTGRRRASAPKADFQRAS